MSDYQFRIKNLSQLVQICKRLSTIENEMSATTLRAIEAEKIFEKITLHAISLLKLLQSERDGNYETFDASAIANIARTIIETHNVFQYICESNITEEELRLRIDLMILHKSKDKQKILSKFDFTESDESWQVSLLSQKYAIRSIKKNKFFMILDNKDQQNLLKGNKAFYFDRMKNTRSPIEKVLESGVYNYLSNSVHSFPLGLYNYSLNSGNSLFGIITLVFIAVEASIMYLANVTNSYLRVRKKLTSLISDDDKQFVKEMIRSEYFQNWLENEKVKGLSGFFSSK
ncbi:hypothetical protein [Paenibacillus sp. DYY-L-2]|uniref:hypothetical protein n=1 Tax=Paenibacillus sp. DYY-L-2 TaxID=3447013 RepID=UPI003F5008C2